MNVPKQIAENFLLEPYPDGLGCFTHIEDAGAASVVREISKGAIGSPIGRETN